MNRRTIASYGVPVNGFRDQKAVKNPETQLGAEYANKLFSDVSQLGRTAVRAILRFPTVAAGDSTPGYTMTLWGEGVAFYPTTVTRTGVGLYTVTYPTSQVDEFGEAENISFVDIVKSGVYSTSVIGRVQGTVSANVVSLLVLNSASVAADLTVGTLISVALI